VGDVLISSECYSHLANRQQSVVKIQIYDITFSILLIFFFEILAQIQPFSLLHNEKSIWMLAWVLA
jgi:hypothetical protein